MAISGKNKYLHGRLNLLNGVILVAGGGYILLRWWDYGLRDELAAAVLFFVLSFTLVVRLFQRLGYASDATEGMRGGEEMFRTLLEASPDAIAVSDLDGTLTWANQQDALLHGYQSADELKGKNVRDLVLPDDLATIEEAVKRCLAGDVIQALGLHLRREGGEAVPVEVNMALLRATDGTPKGFIAVVRDITGRLEAVKALHESGENFRAIAENVRDGIIIVGEDGKLEYFNRRLEEMLGSAPDESLAGRLLALACPPETEQPADGFPTKLNRICEDGMVEIPLQRLDGRVIEAEITPGETTWHGKNAALLMVRDITEPRQKETEIRHRNYELELLAELSSVMRLVDEREEMAALVLERAVKVFEMEAGVLVFNQENLLRCGATRGFKQDISGKSFYLRDRALWEQLLTGEPLVIEDTAAEKHFRLGDLRTLLPDGQSFMLIIPLKADNEISGLVILLNHDHKVFSPSETRLMKAVADMTGTALERMSVYENLEKRVADRTRELSALYHVSAVANQYGEAAIIYSQALMETLSAVGCMTGGIFILDQNKALKLAARQGGTEEFFNNLLNLPNPGWAEQVLIKNRPVLVQDIRQDPAFSLIPNLDNSSFIGVPVRSGNQVLGCIAVIGEEFERFTLEDVSLLISIGEQIGTAAVKVRLQDQSRQLAVDRERRRLARDLHDSVTQQIYSLTLFAGAGVKFLGIGDFESGLKYFKRIEEVAEQALKGMRLLIFELRPAVLKSVGLSRALRQRLESVEQRAGIEVLIEAPEVIPLTASKEESMFHIATEALNNSLRHAHATQVRVLLRAADDLLVMEVADNGQGFTPGLDGDEGGMGLKSMRERVEMMGGKYSLTSTPGDGTRIRVEIEVKNGRTDQAVDRR